MRPLRFLIASSLALMLLASSIARALNADEAFLAASDAYKNGDIETLNAKLPLLDDYELLPYVQYWRLSLQLDTAHPQEIRDFLKSVDGTLVADRMRAKWLRYLADQGDWREFLAVSADLSTWDTELICDSLQARIALGEGDALREARDLWFTGEAQPESCLPLFDALYQQDQLQADAVWARFRLALNAGNAHVAKAILKYLPEAQQVSSRTIDAISRRPQKYLQKLSTPLNDRGQTELALYALYKTARAWPDVAADTLDKIQEQLSEEDRNYAWGQVAMAAAWQHHPEAHSWFEKADLHRLGDTQLEWRVRAALRGGDWADIVGCIEAMSPPTRAEARS